jgi:N-acetylneuraminate synthase
MSNMSGKTFIIAEAGINHNGSRDILRQLIDGAVDAKASAIKFQKRTVDLVYTKEFLDSPRESPWGTTQKAQKMGLELTKSDYDFIDEYCKGKILWSASCWDIPSQLFLRQYDVAFNKIASPMLTSLDFISTVAKEGKYTYISTGMSYWDEITQAVEIFRKYNCPFSLLHTVSTYPTDNKDSNLLMINTLRERYKCNVGFSSHSRGRIVPLVATGMGIDSLEIHVTLDKTLYGSDQAASLELDDFKKLVIDVRGIEKALGTGERILSEAELEVRKKLRGN